MINITLPNGTKFGIDESNNMFIDYQNEPHSRIYFGEATTENFTHILEYIDQLEIHTESKS